MRCLNCKHDKVGLNEIVCPNCGVHLESAQGHVLKPQTSLRDGRYIIEYALGQGGFGITYRAVRADTGKRVAIKEFYPNEFAYRDRTSGSVGCMKGEGFGRSEESFRKEAEMLSKVRHPGIVEVYDVFSERGTSYIVMEYLSGKPLSAETFPLQEPRVRLIMTRLTDAVAEAHRNHIVHLDIKPDNTMLTDDGRIVLIDFGAARQVTATTMKTTRSVAYTAGYAPMELESGNRELIGTWSDVYELGALLHEMLTGQLPPPSADRVMSKKKWTPALEKPWQEMCTAALSIHPDERPKVVQTWWGAVAEFDRATAAKAEAAKRREQERREKAAQEKAAREAAEQVAAQKAAQEKKASAEAKKPGAKPESTPKTPTPVSKSSDEGNEWLAKSLGGVGGLLIGGGVCGAALGFSAPTINSTKNWLLLVAVLVGAWGVNTIARKAGEWVEDTFYSTDYAARSFGFTSANLLRFASWFAVCIVLLRGYNLWNAPTAKVVPPPTTSGIAIPVPVGQLRPRSVWLDTNKQAILYIDKAPATTKAGSNTVGGILYIRDTEYRVTTQLRPQPGKNRIPFTVTTMLPPRVRITYSGAIYMDRVDLYRNGTSEIAYSFRSAFANGKPQSIPPLTTGAQPIEGSWKGFIGNSGNVNLTIDSISSDGVLSGVATTTGEIRRIAIRGAAFPFGDQLLVVLEETEVLEGGNWVLGMNVGFLDEDGLLAGKGGDGSSPLYDWEFERGGPLGH